MRSRSSNRRGNYAGVPLASSGGRPGTPGPLASRSELRHVDDEHTHNTHEALLERLLVRAEALCDVVGRGLELAPRIVPVAHLIDLLLGDVDVVLDEQRVLLLDGEEVVKPMAMILVTAVEMVFQMATEAIAKKAGGGEGDGDGFGDGGGDGGSDGRSSHVLWAIVFEKAVLL